MFKLVQLFAVLSLVISSCKPIETMKSIETPSAKASIYGSWKLQQIKVDTGEITFEHEYHLKIDSQTVQFNYDCNQCVTSNYTITSDSLYIGSGPCTKKGCPPSFYLTTPYLNYNGSYSIANNKLHIKNSKGTRFVFVR